MRTFILSEKRLKENTIIGDNVDSKYLYPALQLAQEISLVEIIGSSLYNRIINDIENNTLTGDYKALVDDYILPYLEFETVARIGSLLQYKYRNGGVVTNQDEHFSTADKEMILFLFDENKNNASAYANRLKKELITNGCKYPELNEGGAYNFNPKNGGNSFIYFEK